MTERVVELTIEQEVTVDFEAVLSGVAEEVEVPFDDLRTESRYVDLRPELVCVALDVETTFIEITSLTGPDVMPLDFSIEVSSTGTGSWIPLATFSGNVESGTKAFFADPDFAVDSQGDEFLLVKALSDTPVYDVRIIGVPGADASALVVDFHLELKFSSQLGGCSPQILR